MCIFYFSSSTPQLTFFASVASLLIHLLYFLITSFINKAAILCHKVDAAYYTPSFHP
jgi:hypothetical protein